jgi:parvulin-like peptidyl-prolyl isomerase
VNRIVSTWSTWSAWHRAAWIGIIAGALAACSTPTPAPLPDATRVTSAATSTLLPTIPPTPTVTPEPLAARVNGEPITLAAFEQEEQRCRAGKTQAGLDPADCPALALQSLIEQRVVEQAALAAGITVTDSEVESALSQIVSGLGGPEAYQVWLTANLYTDDEFREALRRERLRARMAEQVMAQVGGAAEQVHAQAILVGDEAAAQTLLAQIQGGADFAQLALAYSLDLSTRAAGGDLGWFPRGVLTAPEVEEAAFALQPGETSGVIRSALGWHIVQTLERDPARPLSPGAAQTLRARAYRLWLDEWLAKAVVERLVTP